MRKSDKSHQNHFAPDSAPATTAGPLAQRLSQEVLRGHIPMPTGARASSVSRPFGLNFACAPRSACFKGQEKQSLLPIFGGVAAGV